MGARYEDAVFIFMDPLNNIQIKLCDETLKFLQMHNGTSLRTNVEIHLENIFGEKFKDKDSYIIIDTILIRRYQLVINHNSGISLTSKGVEVACLEGGIKDYIKSLQQQSQIELRLKKLQIKHSISVIVTSIIAALSFMINIFSDSVNIKYVVCFIGAFLLGILLSGPIKNLLKRQ